MTDLVFKPAFDRFPEVGLVDEHHTVELVPVTGEIDSVITQEHIHGIGRVTGPLPGDFSFFSVPHGRERSVPSRGFLDHNAIPVRFAHDPCFLRDNIKDGVVYEPERH